MPIARGFTPTALTGEIFRHLFAGSEPPRVYAFLVGLTAAGTPTLVSAVEDLLFIYNH